ncbi:MAG: methylated-DNA--[Oscillospiraceae bacterium]|nr:methylated-DNA--[protein]-cysteine S-methyltransferase [Oscillospiraceae bacterium]
MTYYQKEYISPIGPLTLASDGTHLMGLWVKGQKYYGGVLAGKMVPAEDGSLFAAAEAWLEDYFAGKRPDPAALPLAPIGSEFRQRVWKLLLEIPYGQVMTYGEIAKRLDCGSAQAIGGAVGHNPISIIIPCHRVVGSSGSLTGFAGGLDKKRWLLAHEGVDVEKLKQAH